LAAVRVAVRDSLLVCEKFFNCNWEQLTADGLPHVIRDSGIGGRNWPLTGDHPNIVRD
jgi:hypothetical protein